MCPRYDSMELSGSSFGVLGEYEVLLRYQYSQVHFDGELVPSLDQIIII